jgi:hypothetical protein
MKKILALGLGLVLMISSVGCTQQSLLTSVAVSATKNQLSPATVATLTSICRSGSPFIEYVATLPYDNAKIIASYLGSYCSQLLAGSVPATTDLNTVSWLEQNLNILKGFMKQ